MIKVNLVGAVVCGVLAVTLLVINVSTVCRYQHEYVCHHLDLVLGDESPLSPQGHSGGRILRKKSRRCWEKRRKEKKEIKDRSGFHFVSANVSI